MALLLASFLEICGCNPVRSCEQLRATRLSAIPWETLLEQCARCLSARELLILRQAQETSVVYGVANTLLHDATVEESLGEVHGPSFDGPPAGDLDARVIHRDAGEDTSESITDAKPIAWPISESVLFLYASAPVPGETAQRIGTGFILKLPQESTGNARFLVTARHVVDPEWARCGRPNPQSITVRLTRRAGGISYRTLLLERDQVRQFLTSPDPATDLALIPLSHKEVADLDDFKLADTAIDTLPTESELSTLHEAQEIATVGVAPPEFFRLMDFPISESGMITSLDEGAHVPVRCALESPAKSIRIWLINANVEGGLSGAPVYAAFARGPHHVSTPLLVGIQAVVWHDRGEAGITPVAALIEILKMRRAGVQLAVSDREAPPG
ncbi:serine protease [Granulicella aggregans]|uniref:serine protease n=1 Tax=Granulicella aggregans TaxID=474949 RepID=UPI0021DFA124|nr:serine protease [Granulicella aggregans]